MLMSLVALFIHEPVGEEVWLVVLGGARGPRRRPHARSPGKLVGSIPRARSESLRSSVTRTSERLKGRSPNPRARMLVCCGKMYDSPEPDCWLCPACVKGSGLTRGRS